MRVYALDQEPMHRAMSPVVRMYWFGSQGMDVGAFLRLLYLITHLGNFRLVTLQSWLSGFSNPGVLGGVFLSGVLHWKL